MVKSSRDEFSAKTKRDLAARAGHVCSFPGCRHPTSGPSAEAPDASVNLGEACHIRAAASGPGARRYDPSMSSAERSSIDNGIWMCRTHAKLIDSDEATYTIEELHRWKDEAESRAERRLRDGSTGEPTSEDDLGSSQDRPDAGKYRSDPPDTVFISYASRYREWVRVLHRNLALCLGPDSIFLDEADLGPGRSWVSGLQAGLERAARVVLVASPEAFASPWVRHELESFQAQRPSWKAEGLLSLALLVETPLPPFLASAQHIDFRDHDEASYRTGLSVMVAALQGIRDPHNLPTLPDDLEVPDPPVGGLPSELRGRLVRVLSPLFRPRFARTAVAARLGLDPAGLEDHASAPLAVSAALTLGPSGRHPADQARRVVAAILDEELAGGDPALAEELRGLQQEIARSEPTRPSSSPAAARALPMPADLVHPTGTVAVGSELYVARESDADAEREMGHGPGLVHILGPRQIGKSSLITRLIDRARNDPAGPLVVSINFQDLDAESLSDLRSLLVQLAMEILDAAGRDPETALEIERTRLSAKMACKRLVRREVLTRHSRGVLVALDETDRLVRPGGCADDFFSMLRAWHEAGKQDQAWAGLRLALVFCTEAYMVPEGMSESPLANVGLKCYLRDFHRPEVEQLASRHGLSSAGGAGRAIMEQLGGNPYLTRRALYALAVEGYDFERVISEAHSGAGPLGDHLERHLRHLQAVPELAQAMRGILRHSECRDESRYRSLEGLGLVRRDGTQVLPRYRLYRDFLRERL